MKHKELAINKIDQIANGLTALDSMISNGRTVYEIREMVDKIKEKLSDVITILNNESDSWN